MIKNMSKICLKSLERRKIIKPIIQKKDICKEILNNSCWRISGYEGNFKIFLSILQLRIFCDLKSHRAAILFAEGLDEFDNTI